MENKNNLSFKTIRQNQGFTQEEFAKLLGVSRSTVAKIENEQMGVSDKIIQKLIINFPNDSKLYNLYTKKGNLKGNLNYTNNEFLDVKTNNDTLILEKTILLKDIEYLWDWIDSAFSNIIDIYGLLNDNDSKNIIDKYSFLSDIRNKYYDEKIFYKTGKEPWTEREYLVKLVNVKASTIYELIQYKENLINNYSSFQDIFNRALKDYMKDKWHIKR